MNPIEIIKFKNQELIYVAIDLNALELLQMFEADNDTTVVIAGVSLDDLSYDPVLLENQAFVRFNSFQEASVYGALLKQVLYTATHDIELPCILR